MSGKFPITRRAFMQSATATAVASQAQAQGIGELLPFLKITPYYTAGKIIRIEFLFKNKKHGADKVDRFRLEAAWFSADSTTDAEIVGAEQDNIPYFTISQIHTNGFDELGFFKNNQSPVITLHNPNMFGLNKSVKGRDLTHIFRLKKDHANDENPWRVSLTSNFWRRWNRAGGAELTEFESLTFPRDSVRNPELREILKGRSQFELRISSRWIAPTFSRVFGLGMRASVESIVTFGRDAAHERDWAWQVKPRWRQENGPLLGGYRFLGGKLVLDSFTFGIMTINGTQTFTAEFTNLRLKNGTGTWRSKNGTSVILKQSGTHKPNVRFSSRIDDTGKSYNSIEIELSIDTELEGDPISLRSVSKNDTQILEMEGDWADIPAPILRQDWAKIGRIGPGVLEVRNTASVKDLQVNSPAFGWARLNDEAVSYELVLTIQDIQEFRLEGRLSQFPATLREEHTKDEDLVSTLSWPDPAEQPLTQFVLVGVYSGLPDLSEQDDALEERSLEPQYNFVVLDWSRNDPHADAQFPVDIALDGAVLGARRSKDHLALDFGFFNFRLQHIENIFQLRSDPKTGAYLSNTESQSPERPILAVHILGVHVFKEAFARETIGAKDMPSADLAKLEPRDDQSFIGEIEWSKTDNNFLKRLTIEQLLLGLRLVDRPIKLLIKKEIYARLLDRFDDEINAPQSEPAREIVINRKKEFEDFSDALKSAVSDKNAFSPTAIPQYIGGQNQRIPDDQGVYIGPDFFDRDVWDIARKIKGKGKEEIFPEIAKSRHGMPSRLCFMWDTRRTHEVLEPFSLKTLLNWDRADLSVPLRAQKLFSVDKFGKRRTLIDDNQMLALQGFGPSTHGLAIGRMAEVYKSASRKILPFETSMALLSRLEFSMYQDAQPLIRQPIDPNSFAVAADTPRPDRRPLWQVSVSTLNTSPGVRAIDSPDFKPEVFLKAAQNLTSTYPASNKPYAPWEVEYARFENGELIKPSDKEPAAFNNAIGRYDRHNLVGQSSIYGLPGVGKRILKTNENVVTDSTDGNAGTSFVTPDGYQLVDIDVPEGEFLQTIIRPQTLNFTEISLSSFGPSISMDALFSPEVSAKWNGRSLYPAMPLMRVSSETTDGEDEETRIVTKGYLFPLGHKATRTEYTVTHVVHPDNAEDRKYPATYEVKRTWLNVSEPVKTRWFQQAFEGREWPSRSVEILTLTTPDLVAIDGTDQETGPVHSSGKIDLGTDSGAVFWPRTAKNEQATFKFEVQIDGDAGSVQMPLIFVSLDAADDALTMQRLADYYNNIQVFKDSKRNKPPKAGDLADQSLRIIKHGGARRRYAEEIKDGDSTYETLAWAIGVEGHTLPAGQTEVEDLDLASFPMGKQQAKQRAALLRTNNRNFRFSPLLAASDQPPFYPFIQFAEIKLERVARQMGMRSGPKVLASFDMEYLAATAQIETSQPLNNLPPPEVADVIMGIRTPVALNLGANGDKVGAIGRPAGKFTAIARREGPLLMGDDQKLGDIKESLDKFNLAPTKYREYFSPKQEEEGAAIAKKTHGLDGLVKQVLGDNDAKILGIMTLSELITEAVGALSDNIPIVEEVKEFGADILGEGGDYLRNNVLEPLADLTTKIRQRFEDVDVFGDYLSANKPSLVRAYPQVDSSLKALEQALKTATATDDDAKLLGELTKIYSSGKALFDAMSNVAKDPVTPIRRELRRFFDEDIANIALVSIFNALADLETVVADFQSVILGVVKAYLLEQIDKKDWRFILSSGLKSSKDEALKIKLAAFAKESAESAINILFDEDSFESFIANNHPNAEKWQAFRKARAQSFKENVLAEIKEDVDKEATALIGRVLAQIMRLENRLDSASEAQKAKLTKRLNALYAQFTLAVFGLDTSRFEKLVKAAGEAAKVVGNIGSGTKAEAALKATGQFLSVVDQVYYQGHYKEALKTVEDDLKEDFANYVRKGLRGIRDYASVLTMDAQNIRRSVYNSDPKPAPSVEQIGMQLQDALSYADLDITKIGDAEKRLVSIRKQLEEIIDKQDLVLVTSNKNVNDLGIERDEFDVVGPAAKFMLVYVVGLENILKAMENAHQDVRAGLQAFLAKEFNRLNRLLADSTEIFEGYFLSFAAAIEASEQYLKTVHNFPSSAALKSLAPEDLLKKAKEFPKNQLHAALSAWPPLLAETEALSSKLINDLQQLSKSNLNGLNTDSDAFRLVVDQATDAVKSTSKTLVDNLQQGLSELAAKLCQNALKAVQPQLKFVFRTISFVTDDAALLADRVLLRKKQIVTEYQTLLGELESAIESVNEYNIFGPIKAALLQVTGGFKGALLMPDAAPLKELIAAKNTIDEYFRAMQGGKKPDAGDVVEALEALPRKLKAVIYQNPLKPPDVPALDLNEIAAATAINALNEVIDFADEALSEPISGIATVLREEIFGILDNVTQPLGKALISVYGTVIEQRKAIIKLIVKNEYIAILGRFVGIKNVSHLFLAIDPRGLSEEEIATKKVELLKKKPIVDKLHDELNHLETLANENAESSDKIEALLHLYRAYDRQTYVAAPIQISEQIQAAVAGIVQLDIGALLDLSDLRDEIEKQIRALIPSRISTSLTFKTKMKSLGGIFIPKGDQMFRINGETSVDLLDLSSFSASTTATLSPFEIRLLGEGFDAFTMIFSDAKFTIGTGQKPDFDVRFVDYKVGKELKFVEDLAKKLGQNSGGLYLEPAPGFPGITVGYRISIPAISFGAVNFMNVGIVVGAVLPFDKRDAFFLVGVSTRSNPFIITVGVWGGGGHVAIYSNGRKIIGFELSFVFAGGGDLSYGPLTLQGRVSVGVFIRKIGDLTEISGDFYAGGHGNIAIFSISSSLTVRTGQDVAGNMVGSAVFNFSFSVGFAKIRYSIVLFRKEGQGLSNADQNQRKRVANWPRGLKNADPRYIGDAETVIEVARMEDDYAAWSGYFEPISRLGAGLDLGFGEL